MSDVLSLLRPQGYMSGAIDKGGDWAIRFGAHDGMKFQAVIKGGMWLSVDGVPEPIRLEAGDYVLLPRGRPFRMASDLSLPPMDAHEFLKTPLNGLVRTLNQGGDCYSLGCYFAFSGSHADLLLGMLPPVVHVREESDKAAMRWFVERLMLEIREPQPGGYLVAQQLANLLLLQALRLQLNAGMREGGVGWLFALADRQLSAAISAMHGDPARRWSLKELADVACMSRSTFALRFRHVVGVAPMDYLTRWRMMKAADRLLLGGDAVGVLASSLGYESESAFSTAFKRVMGASPREYGRKRPRSGAALERGEDESQMTSR